MLKKNKNKNGDVEKQKLNEINELHHMEVKVIEETLKKSEQQIKSLFNLRSELEKDIVKIGDAVENTGDTGMDAVKSQLECPVCLEMMKPPRKIWMCPQTHLICDECREGMANNVCPTCRSGKMTMRAFLAENMARALFGK